MFLVGHAIVQVVTSSHLLLTVPTTIQRGLPCGFVVDRVAVGEILH
jgi:hypothetical protein